MVLGRYKPPAVAVTLFVQQLIKANNKGKLFFMRGITRDLRIPLPKVSRQKCVSMSRPHMSPWNLYHWYMKSCKLTFVSSPHIPDSYSPETWNPWITQQILSRYVEANTKSIMSFTGHTQLHFIVLYSFDCLDPHKYTFNTAVSICTFIHVTYQHDFYPLNNILNEHTSNRKPNYS